MQKYVCMVFVMMMSMVLQAVEQGDALDPKVFEVTWGHLDSVSVQTRFWKKSMARAKQAGFMGMYTILPASAVDMDPADLAGVCAQYLDTCQEEKIKCYMSFSSLEGAREVGHCADEFDQPMLLSEGVQAGSKMVDAFVHKCGTHKALEGLVILEEMSEFNTPACYLPALRTLIRKVRAQAPRLPIVIKGAENNADQVEHIRPLTREFQYVVPGCSFWAFKRNGALEDEKPWTYSATYKYMTDVFGDDVPQNLCATFACSPRLSDKERVHYMRNALNVALKRGWPAFLYSGHRGLPLNGTRHVREEIESVRRKSPRII